MVEYPNLCVEICVLESTLKYSTAEGQKSYPLLAESSVCSKDNLFISICLGNVNVQFYFFASTFKTSYPCWFKRLNTTMCSSVQLMLQCWRCSCCSRKHLQQLIQKWQLHSKFLWLDNAGLSPRKPWFFPAYFTFLVLSFAVWSKWEVYNIFKKSVRAIKLVQAEGLGWWSGHISTFSPQPRSFP